MTTNIAITGASGVIGSQLVPALKADDQLRLIELTHHQPHFESFGVSAHSFDLTSPSSVTVALTTTSPDVIIHLAAATHIDHCEVDRVHGQSGRVWQTNVVGTEQIVEYAAQHNTYLIFLSTECVFDGEVGFYTETAHPTPKNWYGTTKAAAEQAITHHLNTAAIIRAAIAYHAEDGTGTMTHAIRQLYERHQPFQMVDDQYVTFTYVADIIATIRALIAIRMNGIFHVSSNQESTPYQLALAVASRFGFDSQLVKPTTMVDFFGSDRAALRLRHASLTAHHTSQRLGIFAKTIEEALQ